MVESTYTLADEFRQSWQGVAAFFGVLVQEYDSDQLRPMLVLIQMFCDEQLDSELRAGTSLSTLVISRARRHGLRERDPAISFHSQGDDRFLLTVTGVGGIRETRQVLLGDFDPRQDPAVQELLQTPIH